MAEKTWEIPTGERIDAWRYDGTDVEVRLTTGKWITWSTGCHVEDDRAWLRIHGVPQLPDRND